MNESWLAHKFHVYNCKICNSQLTTWLADCSKICWSCRTTPMCRLRPKVSKVGRLKAHDDYRVVSALIIDRKSLTLLGTDTHFY